MDGPLVLVPIIGSISFFGCVGLILYMYFKTRHKERMALIENGQDASVFKQSDNRQSNLKWGLISISIGIALFLGHFLEEYTAMDDGAGYFPLIFIFGGAALIYHYRRLGSEYLDDNI